MQFLSNTELSSASTDSTLRLWDVKDNLPVSYSSTLRSCPFFHFLLKSLINFTCNSFVTLLLSLSFCFIRFLFSWFHLQLCTYRGHTNERNFVGLTVNSDYIACGSETNEVFVYHKVREPRICNNFFLNIKIHLNANVRLQAISKPMACHKFSSLDPNDNDEDGGSHFISAVCWKSDSPTMLAANSGGTIKVLVLAPWGLTDYYSSAN